MKNNKERVMSIMKKVEDRKKQRGEVLTATTLGLCTVLGLFFYTNFNGNILDLNIIKNNGYVANLSGDINGKEFASVEEIKLPTFTSKQEILDKLKTNDNHRYYMVGDMVIFEEMDGSASTTINSAVTGGNIPTAGITDDLKQEVNKEHSSTNVQVDGVDEGDIVKTNGNYIYYIKNNNLYIFETKTTKTKLIKTVELGKKYALFAKEIYIDDNYITVITEENVNRNDIVTLKDTNDEKESGDSVNYDVVNKNDDTNKIKDISKKVYSYSTTITSMSVYDINSYELVKNVKTEGTYISSRKINDNIYMVTNRYLYYYRIDEDNVLPIYSETSYTNETKENNTEIQKENDAFKEIPADCIRYFPDISEECNYMIITSLNLADIDKDATVETYLGAGTEIYCSKENLYVTRVERPYRYYGGIIDVVSTPAIEIDSVAKTEESTSENSISDSENVEETAKSKEEVKNKMVTQIHKFKLLDGAVKYVATGEVDGALLNQYSMDENNEYFRITTTSNEGNSLYVLDKELKVVGELENLAKGEKIYATRFMGNKCYMVTYKTVDPLYVIDLSNPENPTVLGELKLPGYSTYLHPLGENYLIGFGEDSIEKNYIDWQGNSQVTAYNIGLKLAIFDVSDLENPKEIHSVRIGGRGSSSDLLHNPKSLYYDVEEGIFAFPAMLYEETKYYEDGTPRYGDIVFKGALVYDLSVDEGIELRGKIQHEGTEKFDNNIERIISIGENFYTISPEMIKVTEIETMKEVKGGTCKF